jgi:hypothetical protein
MASVIDRQLINKTDILDERITKLENEEILDINNIVNPVKDELQLQITNLKYTVSPDLTTAQFQKAIDQSDGRIYFKPGIYILNDIVINQLERWYCGGSDITITKITNAASFFYIYNAKITFTTPNTFLTNLSLFYSEFVNTFSCGGCSLFYSTIGANTSMLIFRCLYSTVTSSSIDVTASSLCAYSSITGPLSNSSPCTFIECIMTSTSANHLTLGVAGNEFQRCRFISGVGSQTFISSTLNSLNTKFISCVISGYNAVIAINNTIDSVLFDRCKVDSCNQFFNSNGAGVTNTHVLGCRLKNITFFKFGTTVFTSTMNILYNVSNSTSDTTFTGATVSGNISLTSTYL